MLLPSSDTETITRGRAVYGRGVATDHMSPVDSRTYLHTATILTRLELETNLREVLCFTILEMAPTSAFSRLKVSA